MAKVDPGKARLLFVYNAKEDPFSKVFDFAHKIISPATYQCQLCSITYGNTGVRKDWRKFLERLRTPPVFFYKEEWKRSGSFIPTDLPAVLQEQAGGQKPVVILSKQQLQHLKTLPELIRKLEKDLPEGVLKNKPGVDHFPPPKS